jgi:hypothetical protein
MRRGELSTQRKQYSAECKARFALDAVKGLKTVNELASTSGGASHPDHALETSAPQGDPRHFLGTTGEARARPRGVPSATLPTNWATQGGP